MPPPKLYAKPSMAVFRALDDLIYNNDFLKPVDTQIGVQREVFDVLSKIMAAWDEDVKTSSANEGIPWMVKSSLVAAVVDAAEAPAVGDESEQELWDEVRRRAKEIVLRELESVEWDLEDFEGEAEAVEMPKEKADIARVVALENALIQVIIELWDELDKGLDEPSTEDDADTELPVPATAVGALPAAGPKARPSRKNAGAKSSGARWDSKEELFSWVMCWDTVTGEKNERQNFSQRTRQAVFNDWRNANNFADIRTWYSVEQHIKALKGKKKKEMYADVRAKVVAKYGEATALQIVAEATQATTNASAREKAATDAQKRAKAEEKNRIGKERRAASKADQPKEGEAVKRPASEEPLDDPTQSSDGNGRKHPKLTATAEESNVVTGTTAAHVEEQQAEEETANGGEDGLLSGDNADGIAATDDQGQGDEETAANVVRIESTVDGTEAVLERGNTGWFPHASIVAEGGRNRLE
ncbi:hypothetical protein LTR17_012506 [Elasticomyces elasticus]|nr:hypothetical protein LTR17_012506 [Elasticomyces elasticus]